MIKAFSTTKAVTWQWIAWSWRKKDSCNKRFYYGIKDWFDLNRRGDNVDNNLINTVLNNLQPIADFAGLLILDNRPHNEEIKHNERGCMDNVNFKRRNLQSTLASHEKHEWKSWQTNWSYTKSWKQAKCDKKGGWTKIKDFFDLNQIF